MGSEVCDGGKVEEAFSNNHLENIDIHVKLNAFSFPYTLSHTILLTDLMLVVWEKSVKRVTSSEDHKHLQQTQQLARYLTLK